MGDYNFSDYSKLALKLSYFFAIHVLGDETSYVFGRWRRPNQPWKTLDWGNKRGGNTERALKKWFWRDSNIFLKCHSESKCIQQTGPTNNN